MSVIETAADYLAISFLVPLVVFITLYATRSNWRATSIGIIVLFQKIGFALVMALSFVRVMLSDFPGEHAARISVYALVLVMLWADVYMLIRYQSDDFDAKKPAHRRQKNRKNL